MSDILLPKSFLEILAAVLMGFSLLFGFWSMHNNSKSQATKLLALSMLSSIAIFSNHGSTYFVVIFIIATSITDVDFLQTLAAIIRGNKYYFDYKKRTLTDEEKIQKESKEEKILNIKRESIVTESMARMPWMNVEDAAFKEIEKYFGKDIQRNIRIEGKRRASIEVDGLIEGDETADIVIEIKYLKDVEHIANINSQLDYFEQKMAMYKEITGRRALLHLVVVVDDENILTQQLFATLKERVNTRYLLRSVSMLTLKDIGL